MLVGNLQDIDRAETLGYPGVSRHSGLRLDLAAGDVAVVVVEVDGVGLTFWNLSTLATPEVIS